MKLDPTQWLDGALHNFLTGAAEAYGCPVYDCVIEVSPTFYTIMRRAAEQKVAVEKPSCVELDANKIRIAGPDGWVVFKKIAYKETARGKETD